MTVTGSWVLIENQLEKTDHCHLGQLLTYAAGLKAVTIVWIAERFTDEHRSALDWLNEITDEQFNFFGLEIELWRIGVSPVAPKFNVISKPNDWSKSVTEMAHRIESGGLSETRQLQYDFWKGLGEFLTERKSIVKPQKPQPQQWTNFAIGRSSFALVAVLNVRDGWISAKLAILGPSAEGFFVQLENQRQQIEESLGQSSSWRRSEGMERSIEMRCEADPTDQANWPKYYDWLATRLELLHKTLAPRIKALKVDPIMTEPAE